MKDSRTNNIVPDGTDDPKVKGKSNNKGKKGGKNGKSNYRNTAKGNSSNRVNPNRDTATLKGSSAHSTISTEITKIVGSLQFPPYIGIPMPEFKSSKLYPSHGIPTVCEIPLYMTYGQANGMPSDTLNTAAIQLYSSIVAKLNRAPAGYDANDLMVACICCDSLVATYNYMKSVISHMLTYTSSNRALPRVTVEAMGFDFDDIETHLDQVRLDFEMFTAKMNALQIPKVLDIYDEHSYLTSNIFCDEDSVYPQVYVFQLENYYVFDQSSHPGTTNALSRPLNGSETVPLKAADIKYKLYDMYDSLFTSFDFGNMLADLRTAFPDADIVLESPNFEAMTPVYDKDILMALHNATPAKHVDVASLSYNSSLDGNYAAVITSVPTIMVKSYGYSGRIFLDMTSEYQNPEGIVSLTRWTIPTYEGESITKSAQDVSQVLIGRQPVANYILLADPAVGTEIIGYPKIHMAAYENSTSNKIVDAVISLDHYGGDLDSAITEYPTTCLSMLYAMNELYTMFDYLPMIPCVYTTTDVDVIHFDSTPQHVIGMKDCVTTITNAQVERIHNYRIMDMVLKY